MMMETFEVLKAEACTSVRLCMVFLLFAAMWLALTDTTNRSLANMRASGND